MMGKKSCRGLCQHIPDVVHRPWWRPRLVGWLYCPACGVSFPDLKIFYKLDKFGRKTCICCGTTLRQIPRRSKRWKSSPLYKSIEEPAKTTSGEEDEELLRCLILARYDEDDGDEGD